MADIWAAPPGASIDRGPRLRGALRSLRGFVASFVVVALVLAGGRVVVTKLQTSSPVSTTQALERFRADPGLTTGTETTNAGHPGAKRDNRSAAKPATQGSARTGAAAATTGAAAATTQRGAETTASSATNLTPPRPGVYTWDTEGYEQVPGLRRELPKESHSIIKRTGEHSWTEHQIYSEQREQWLELDLSPDGVSADSVRNRVEFGPIEEDNTIHFDPAAFFLSFPQKVGETWGGEWTGKTRGDYQARTFDHGWMKIGGERVEFYAVEVHMNFHGEVEGESTVRLWSVAEYRMVVKQWQSTDVESGPGNYHSEWTRVLRSLDPEQ